MRVRDMSQHQVSGSDLANASAVLHEQLVRVLVEDVPDACRDQHVP